MDHGRRSALFAIGTATPFGLLGSPWKSTGPVEGPAVLQFRSFEEAVQEAFSSWPQSSPDGAPVPRRIEVGYCELLQSGVQGCHNDRPFAGFPPGHLRIIQCGSEPGPAVSGVRLYVSTVEIVAAGEPADDSASRPLNFASLPPAPYLQSATTPKPATNVALMVR